MRILFDQTHGLKLTTLEQAVASAIYNAGKRLTIFDLKVSLAHIQSQLPNDREIKRTIRNLRRAGLPILSSRTPPCGYWWCRTAEEMRDFVERFKAQPMDELFTLSRIVKNNFPSLAGQLRFDFCQNDKELPVTNNMTLAKTEEDELFEALLGPDEEIDLETAKDVLKACGVDSSDLVFKLRSRVEAGARELRSEGKSVPVSVKNALRIG